MMRQFKIVVEKTPNGCVAYPLGLKGVVVGQGDSYEEALSDVKSAIHFHIETFGSEVLAESNMSSSPSRSLEDNDAQVQKATAKQHGEELRLIEGLLTCCLRGFTRLGSFTLSEDNRLRCAHLLLATRGFNSLHCACELLQQGYYTQALTLVRSAMEDNLTALDCAQCKETLDAVLEGTGKLGKGRLTYAEMAKRQGDEFHKAWTHNYGDMSEYAAHARKNSLKTLVDPDTHNLRLGGLYDRVLFIGTCDALLGAAIGTAGTIAKVLDANAPPWQQECFPIFKAAADWREMVGAKVKAGGDV